MPSDPGTEVIITYIINTEAIWNTFQKNKKVGIVPGNLSSDHNANWKCVSINGGFIQIGAKSSFFTRSLSPLTLTGIGGPGSHTLLLPRRDSLARGLGLGLSHRKLFVWNIHVADRG